MSRLPIWIRQHLVAIRAMIVLTIITGAIYPLAVLGLGQAIFRNQANGSMVTFHGKVVGSALLCQEFTDAKGNPLPRYFQPRPSAAATTTSIGTSKYGCDPADSAGTNLGPDSATLAKNAASYKTAYEQMYHVSAAQVPPDAITTSTSGLEPFISPRNADIQAAEVAHARHLPLPTVMNLVTKYTQGRDLGFLGEPRVNVVTLNIALDELPGQ